MSALVNLIKSTALPGSIPFLIASVVIGAGLLWFGGRAARLARRWLMAIALAYWVLSTPFGADMLVAALQGNLSSFEPQQGSPRPNAVVLLTGGVLSYIDEAGTIEALTSSSALRTLEAARIWKLLGPNAWVVVSGGVVNPETDVRPHAASMRDALIGLGVPAERVLVETASVNTHQHAVYAKDLLRNRGITQFVLVTSPTHIRRSLLAFRAAGLDAIPSASKLHSKDEIGWRWTRWWPSGEALNVSQAVLYDSFALVYYWSRGWLG